MNPIVAAIVSFIIPGLGQAVSGDIKKGIIFFIIAVILAAIISLVFQNWIMYIIDLAYSVYAAYDAYMMNKL